MAQLNAFPLVADTPSGRLALGDVQARNPRAALRTAVNFAREMACRHLIGPGDLVWMTGPDDRMVLTPRPVQDLLQGATKIDTSQGSLAADAKLGGPAVLAAGGRILARGTAPVSGDPANRRSGARRGQAGQSRVGRLCASGGRGRAAANGRLAARALAP